jgi:hypothetical protein
MLLLNNQKGSGKMKKLNIYLAVLVVSVFVALPAMAQKETGQFPRMDANQDGVVTWEEFSDVYPQLDKGTFDRADGDGSGLISHDEWFAFDGKPVQGQNIKTVPMGSGKGQMKGAGVKAGAGTRFTGMDADTDGMLSLTELQAEVPDADAALFKQADVDNNGMLNHAEWSTIKEKLGFGTGRGLNPVGKGKTQ